MDSDTTLQSTLEDYQEKFCNKKCLLELNYKKMNDVIVVFSETDLHHLLGLHYVLPKNIYANKSIEIKIFSRCFLDSKIIILLRKYFMVKK